MQPDALALLYPDQLAGSPPPGPSIPVAQPRPAPAPKAAPEPAKPTAGDVLYPSDDSPAAKPTEKPAGEKSALTAEQAQAALYEQPDPSAPYAAEIAKTVPPNVAELRQAEGVDKLHDPASIYSGVEFYPENVRAELDKQAPGLRQAAEAEDARLCADLGLSADDARTAASVIHGLKELPSSETLASWETEALQSLGEQFGADADEALADAQKLAARDPRLHQFLHRSGLGSNPQIVLMMARAARGQKAKGRL